MQALASERYAASPYRALTARRCISPRTPCRTRSVCHCLASCCWPPRFVCTSPSPGPACITRMRTFSHSSRRTGLAFGYGVKPWEFHEGVRSMVLPWLFGRRVRSLGVGLFGRPRTLSAGGASASDSGRLAADGSRGLAVGRPIWRAPCAGCRCGGGELVSDRQFCRPLAQRGHGGQFSDRGRSRWPPCRRRCLSRRRLLCLGASLALCVAIRTDLGAGSRGGGLLGGPHASFRERWGLTWCWVRCRCWRCSASATGSAGVRRFIPTIRSIKSDSDAGRVGRDRAQSRSRWLFIGSRRIAGRLRHGTAGAGS
jgi:hypothetical protein